ncbi:MAG: thiamine-phosphate kinase [Gammaproteobacteria bacterium]
MALGEFDIIRRYFSDIVAADEDIICGVGDDAAVIAIDAERALVVAADTCVIGVHFPLQTPAYAIGFKSLAVNLSDMAAMGVQPRWCTLALNLPPQYRQADWLAEFQRGFATLAKQHAVSLIGGDTCGADQLSVTVQIIGIARSDQIVYRSGAKPGDAIYVSGELGTAAFALRRLQAEADLPDTVLDSLYQPQPQVTTGQSLAGKVHAMIDISDGLLADLQHILNASGVGAIIDAEAIPANPLLRQQLGEAELWQCLLAGGDDYQLCFTTDLPEAELGTAVHKIGEITADKGLQITKKDGTQLTPTEYGYQHF